LQRFDFTMRAPIPDPFCAVVISHNISYPRKVLPVTMMMMIIKYLVAIILLSALAVSPAAAFVAPSSVSRAATCNNGIGNANTALRRRMSQADEVDDYTIGGAELDIQDTLVGNGEEAKAGDIVTVQYEGRLLKTDKKFDGGSISFKLGEGKVIPGWDQGLQGMKVGGNRILKIPPCLAYGSQSVGDGVIPANSDLIFDCTLKNIGTGPVAEFLAATGLGLNIRSLFVVMFIVSILLPKFGIGQSGFI
jgi:peptidylprolyl isomerase